jgi:arsenate reductase
VIEYLKTPPNVKELNNICKTLGKRPKDIIRKGEQEYKALKINKIVSDDDLLKAMVRHPKLIERPIVIKGEKGIIGRPPENILKLI